MCSLIKSWLTFSYEYQNAQNLHREKFFITKVSSFIFTMLTFPSEL